MVKHTKNEEHIVLISDLGTNGEGIGHLEDGYTLFINGALVGDRVKVRIIKAQKNYGIGRMMGIEEASPERINATCPVADKCGGCQIASLSYQAQLQYKENKVRELLIRVGGFDSDIVEGILQPIIGYYHESAHRSTHINLISSEKETTITPSRFRNKAQYPIGTDKDGNLIAGFYSGHSHRIVPNEDCLIGSGADARILDSILGYMERYHIPAYDESEHKGLVRHVLIRTGFFTGDIMVCLVINGKSLPEKDALVSRLLELNWDDKWNISSICISSNTADTNVIMGDNYQVIYGDGFITDKIGDVKFRISPLSFFQVNPRQTEVLYGTALEYVNLSGNETVWDLYCGIGSISLFLARKAGEVIGVEIVPQAIENAKENARINNIDNARFYVGKAEEVLPEYYQSASRDDRALTPDVIVVDPPRKGCDSACLDTMLQMSPERIVYVSCDPATLSRDLKYLCQDNQYELCKVQPVDMFPNSVHVEIVALLNRQN